ncbi:MAG: ribosome small subunit-dependent GTPase A [bacterium]
MESKDYYVRTEEGEITRCSLRGRYKKQYELKKNKQSVLDIVCVGDGVDFEKSGDDAGVITNIYERKNFISRKAPKIKGATFRGGRLEQIIASNIDYFFIVSSFDEPRFNNRVVDRFLVVAESSKVTPIIIINKVDLDDDNDIQEWVKIYKKIGYNVIKTSVETGYNINKLVKLVKGKTSIFWGQSGVGKSSLLNKIYPQLDLRVGEVSDYSNKGKHTTVSVKMLCMEEDSYLIDTPGIREIDPYGIRQEDLGHYFTEFYPHHLECRFNTCTHNHEPGCAIEKKVEEGIISPYRYESYLNILHTIEDDMLF